MAQLITVSTNGSVGVFARASALFVSMLRTSIGMLNDSGGFLFFLRSQRNVANGGTARSWALGSSTTAEES